MKVPVRPTPAEQCAMSGGDSAKRLGRHVSMCLGLGCLGSSGGAGLGSGGTGLGSGGKGLGSGGTGLGSDGAGPKISEAVVQACGQRLIGNASASTSASVSSSFRGLHRGGRLR